MLGGPRSSPSRLSLSPSKIAGCRRADEDHFHPRVHARSSTLPLLAALSSSATVTFVSSTIARIPGKITSFVLSASRLPT
ncbi:hypothetical protein TIFTF001_010337 [Ficus carica]|uniref:Uncharacterized protein n=1 Tax=Ficus carica TaxID=3494 RepID=A0AA88D4F3_FICCA|nr:hypothetical protein TIFTF001_010337 [Ficus carica]